LHSGLPATHAVSLAYSLLTCGKQTPHLSTVLELQVVAPDGKPLVVCKGAPQIIGNLLHDKVAKAAVDT
jgi:hypothetical protein